MNESILDCMDIVDTGNAGGEEKKNISVEQKSGGADACKITIEQIIEKKPTMSFVLGRSCVGKSTLAKQLSSKGFAVIHLDELIKELGFVDKIKAIYENNADEVTMKTFVDSVVAKSKGKPTIIEGAIKNMSLIDRIAKAAGIMDMKNTSSIMIVYIEPEAAETVERNMVERFQKQLEQQAAAGGADNPLPVVVTPELTEEYKSHGMKGPLINKEMKRYAAETMEISKHRKELFSETTGGNIIYVLPSESIPPANKIGGEMKAEAGKIESKQSDCGCAGIEPGIESFVEQNPQQLEAVADILSTVEVAAAVADTSPFDLEQTVEQAPCDSLVDLSTTIEPHGEEKKRVKFTDEINEAEAKKEKKEAKKASKKKKAHHTSKVTIGGMEYDATGYGVYEIQQRRFRAKNDPEFNPLEMYEGQTYTDGGDIALKMIKKSKINELYNKVIGGLAEAMGEYEKLDSLSFGGLDPETYMVLAVTSPEVKRSDIDDVDWLKEALRSTDPTANITSTLGGTGKMKRLKLTDTPDCKKRLLELEKKTESVIKELEKRITDDINFIEKVTLLLKSRTQKITKSARINGGDENTTDDG